MVDTTLEMIGAGERVVLPYVSKIIAKTFEVSPAVIECRINHMGIGLTLTETGRL